ncbi:MAG: ABC transporter permease [Vicinamibacterales bacterium]
MPRGQYTRVAVTGVALASFVVACVLPLGYLVATSLSGANLAAIVLDSRQRGLLYNTAALGAATALLSTLIGLPLGIGLARVPMRWKGALRLLATIPMVLPPYVVGLAWVYLGSRGSLLVAVAILSLVWYPLSMLATEVAVRRIDRRLEEAGLVVATPERVLRHITLPLALPSILATALVIFVLAVSEFGVPGLLGVRVYATEVFTAFAALYDFDRAILLTMPLLLLCIAAATAAAVMFGDRLVATRRSGMRLQCALDSWRQAAEAGFVLVISTSLVLPTTVLAGQALQASWSETFAGSGQAIVNSLVYAGIAATIIVTVACCLGHLLARVGQGRRLVGQAVLVALFAVPSTLLGVGLIALWNRSGVLGTVYGTDVMLVLGYVARFLPIAVLSLAATARAVPESHEEAASVGGAGWLRMMSAIVLPQMKLGIAVMWVITFVLAFGELGSSILVAPPGETTLPIRIYTLIANAPPSQVAALALLQSAVIVVPIVSLGVVTGLREPR